MLSLWKLRVGAEAYYLSQVASGIDDYYSGNGETPGQWLGTGAAALDLAGAVYADDLRAVLAGLAPGTGLSPNGTQIRTFKGRIPGFDLTFSTPKSVSVMYAFADPLVRAQIVDAVDIAVGEAVSWLEREACFVRRGSNNRQANTAAFEQWGTRRLHGAGFIAAGFRHRTSRAGDPQLHAHVLVANLAKGPDGRWTALDGQALYRSKLAAGVVFQQELRNQMSTRLGVQWRPVHDQVADIAGIPQRVLKHFSKRRNEIEDELERTGLSGPAAAANATLATRTAKLDIDQQSLDEHWIDDAASIGYGPADIDRLLTNTTSQRSLSELTGTSTIAVRTTDPYTGEVFAATLPITGFAARVAASLAERDASVSRHDIQSAVASHLANPVGTALLERLTDAVLADPELVPHPREGRGAGWEEQWTTRTQLRIETELLAAIAPTPGGAHALDPYFVDHTLASLGTDLGPDQADTVRRLCTQGLAVEVVVGRAGTGKTYTMNALRRVYQQAGRRVVGVAPTGRSARELADGAGIDAYTVPRLFTSTHLDASTIVIVDEAAMCGTRNLHRIITHAHTRGAKVILVGDHHQLPEVEAGGGFLAALEAVADRACELTINRRQRHQWEHDALDHLRHGDIGTFWNTFVQHDRVVLDDTADGVHQQAIDDWWATHTAGHSAHLIAGTRSEARLLNTLARHRAATAGHLTGPVLPVRERSFQVGDRIVCLHNHPGQHDLDTGVSCRVDNGMIAAITRIDHTNSDIDIQLANGRRIRLTGEYVQGGNIDHGYATTIHKAQGLTCDNIYVVGPAGLYRQAAYVALSRARNTAHLYATTRDATTLGEPAHTTGLPLADQPVPDTETDILRALTTTHTKHLALTDTPLLDVIAETANAHTLSQLEQRQHHLRDVTRVLEIDGLVAPTVALVTLELAASHRQRMHIGGRVNATDWDNVGTITRLHDATGHATIRFTTTDGRTTTKVLPWVQTKPIDRPEPVELTDLAEAYLTEQLSQLDTQHTHWDEALTDHGIDPHEAITVPAAIEQRQRQLFHRMRATPPDWLTWWVGPRPSDPTAAVVYDDHLATLSSWRDRHQLPHHTPGFGPAPTDPNYCDEWRHRMDTAFATRTWLHTHHHAPDAEPPNPIPLADARHRLEELDKLFRQAPPVHARIVEDLLASTDLTSALDNPQHALDQQSVRRDWILEHWPNVIEHHELTTIVQQTGPLDHWPTPLPAPVQRLLGELARTSVDTPEPRSLPELDRAAAAHNPMHTIRRLEQDVKPIRQQIRTLEREPSADPTIQNIINQHIGRLREQAQALEARIRRTEGQLSLHRWNPAPDPNLAAAITNRTNHLTHTALTQNLPWVHEIASEALQQDPTISAEELAELLRQHVQHVERGTEPALSGSRPIDHRDGIDKNPSIHIFIDR